MGPVGEEEGADRDEEEVEDSVCKEVEVAPVEGEDARAEDLERGGEQEGF